MPKKSRQPRRKAKKHYRIKRMEAAFSSEYYCEFEGKVNMEQFDKLKVDLASIDSGMNAEVIRGFILPGIYKVKVIVKGFMAVIFRESMKTGLMHHWGWAEVLQPVQ